MLRLVKHLAILATASVLAGTAHAQTHDYEFTSGLTDSVGGGAALTSSISPGNTSATFSVTGGNYVFDKGAGLFLGSQLPGSVYTIDMSVALDSISGYNKLISFGNIATDAGLYDLSGALSLYPNAVSSVTTDFVPGQFVDVQISRNAAGTVAGYINGVLRLSYDDSVTNTFTTTGGLWFLRDDTDQNSEQSSGKADFIRIYNTSTIPAPVTVGAAPEPATWAMMIVGFGAVGVGLRRRRQVTTRVSYAA